VRTNQVKRTSDPEVEGVAKYLAAAYLAYYLGMSFNSAMRTYVEPTGVSDFWRGVAKLIRDAQASNPNRKDTALSRAAAGRSGDLPRIHVADASNRAP
jgi:hypothetical protein